MDVIYTRPTHPAPYLMRATPFGDFDMACQSTLGVVLIYSYPLLLLFIIYLLFTRWDSSHSITQHQPCIDSQARLTSTTQTEPAHASPPEVTSNGTTSADVTLPHGQHVADIPLSKRSCQAPSQKPNYSPHAFTSLCDRLFLTNKVWEQEKELKVLRSIVTEKDEAIARTTFSAFADRLLLHNRIWQQENQILELRASCERLKKTQESMITRTAEKMMVDVRKEGMLEDFVKDLIAELEASKKEVTSVREAHEKEIREINGEWLRDYRSLVREVDGLKLGTQARLAEQELASDAEESLLDSLKLTQRKAEILEEKVQAYETANLSYSGSSSIYSTAPCSFYSLQSADGANISSARRRPSQELDDDDTLADFSIASTSGASYSENDMFETSKFLCKMCSHDHGTKSPSHAILPRGVSLEGSIFPAPFSGVRPNVAVSRIPGTCHLNKVFFAPAPRDGDKQSDNSPTSRGRRTPSAPRSRRPTLLPLKLSMSMWPQRKKDHMSPTSASVRKALSPASRSRSRRRVKLAIWRP